MRKLFSLTNMVKKQSFITRPPPFVSYYRMKEAIFFQRFVRVTDCLELTL